MGRLAAFAAAAGFWSPVATLAQTGTTTPPVERRERVEVTGSRLVALDVESASPIHTITAEEIKSEGYPSIEMILNNFPQVVADQGSRVSNGATGTSTVNLRGLLPGRSLVLVNGRRLLSGSPFILAADLNQIPTHLVSRIEIFTGGASAVHGSDAIAGVVNIILKDRFEGVEGTVAYDFYNHRQKNDFMAGLVQSAGYALPGDKRSDGETTSATLTLGGNFAGDKGNAAISFRYVDTRALLQSERDYSACALFLLDRGTPAESAGCGGSSVGYPGRFNDITNNRSWTVADATGGVRPWSRTGDLYNYAPWNYFQRPIERNGFNAFTHYEVAPAARVYGEFGFHDDHTVAQLAPSGVFGGLYSIRWENPLLSPQWRARLIFNDADGNPASGPGTSADVVISRRNVEGGGRRYELRHTSHREVVGLKGRFGDNWDYDTFFQTAKVIASERAAAGFSISRLARAIDVVSDPRTGAPVCASVVNGSDPACIPYNVWTLNGVNQQALDYLELPASRQGFTSQSLLSAMVRGDLERYGGRLPWAKDPIEVAFGVERRSDKMDLSPDAAYMSGDLAGQGGTEPPVKGGVVVREIFGEVRVPVVESLDLSGSYRYSDYSSGVNSNTFGVGFNAAPHRALRLRGSWQRAVRAANLKELFQPEVRSSWGNEVDPCEGSAPTASREQCANTGVTAGQYGRIPITPDGVGGYPAIEGGNPALHPETANTLTLGFALMPSKDFSATLDYFDIRIDDYINGGTPEESFKRCLQTGDPVHCSRITRDPVLGTLWMEGAKVVAINQNIGHVRVTGLDLAFTWRYGSLVDVSGIGTWLKRSDVQIYRGAETLRCAGVVSGDCFEPRPRWRHRIRAAWQLPWSVELATTWRYIHSMHEVGVTGGDLEAVNYFDLALSWAIDRRLTIRAGVNNVTDRDPPLLTPTNAGIANGNTFPQTYDGLGRHVFVSLNAKF
jgi:outer membrane receptor protein involved in Fe transport